MYGMHMTTTGNVEFKPKCRRMICMQADRRPARPGRSLSRRRETPLDYLIFMGPAMILFTALFLIPLVTMRLMSEEMKQRTDQMLLTAPVRVFDIVLGKYLAAMLVFVIALACTLTWPLIVTMFGSPAIFDIIGNYVAMFLLVGCLVSIGLFISSLTESQIIAAIFSFVAMLALYMFSTIASAVDNVVVSTVLNWLSVFSRYSSFTAGVFSLADIVYYISVTVVFLFLTARVIEKKRWA